MSVTLIPSAVDPRICAATQDEAVWRQVLAAAHESNGLDLKGETMALVWTNDRLSAVPRTSLPHRDPSIVGYLDVQRYRIFVYRSGTMGGCSMIPNKQRLAAGAPPSETYA